MNLDKDNNKQVYEKILSNYFKEKQLDNLTDIEKIDEIINTCLINTWIVLFIKFNYLKHELLIRQGDINAVTENIKNIILRIVKLKNDYYTGLCYYLYGLNLCKIRNLKKALVFFNKAKINFEVIQKHALYCKVLRRISLIYLKQKDYINSYKVLNTALHICTEQSINNEKALIYYDLSLILADIAYYDKALSYLYESNRIVLQTNGFRQYSMNQNRLGLIYNELEKYDKALKAFMESEKYCLSYNYQEILADCYLNISRTYKHKADNKQALSYLDKCLVLRKNYPKREKQIEILLFLSDIYNDDHNYKQSLLFLKRACHIGKQSNNIELLAEIYLKHAYCFLNTQQMDNALHFAEKSIKLLCNSGTACRAKIHYFFYEFYKLKEDYKSAYRFFQLYINETNKKQSKEINFNLHQLQLHYEINQIKQKYDENIEIQKADTAFALAVTANHEINQPLMIIQGNLDIINHKLETQNMTKEQYNYIKESENSIEEIEKVLTDFRNHTTSQLKANKRYNELIIE